MLLRWSFLAVIASMAMVPLKAASQPGPGFDCPNEKGPMERIICADKNWACSMQQLPSFTSSHSRQRVMLYRADLRGNFARPSAGGG